MEEFLVFLNTNKIPVPAGLYEPKRRALIVDDNTFMAKNIQMILERKAGFETKIAADGFQAGTLLESFRPAVMTLDLHLPGLNGFEVLAFIREQYPQYGRVKVLVVSAADPQELAEAARAGADDTLAKPFSLNDLLSRTLKLAGITQPLALDPAEERALGAAVSAGA